MVDFAQSAGGTRRIAPQGLMVGFLHLEQTFLWRVRVDLVFWFNIFLNRKFGLKSLKVFHNSVKNNHSPSRFNRRFLIITVITVLTVITLITIKTNGQIANQFTNNFQIAICDMCSTNIFVFQKSPSFSPLFIAH
jgi:hypothetical protein